MWSGGRRGRDGVGVAGGLSRREATTLIGPTGQFFFLLAAVVCFGLAAIGEPRVMGGRPGAASRIALVPLGLALYVFPAMWNTGKLAF